MLQHVHTRSEPTNCAKLRKSHSQRQTNSSQLGTVAYSLRLASDCSKVFLLCSAHCWPDFLSRFSSERDTSREREQTEARERSSFFSQETLCGRGILVYCSSQPVDSLSRGRSFRVQGKVRGHVDSQDCLVSKENKLTPLWRCKYLQLTFSPFNKSL